MIRASIAVACGLVLLAVAGWSIGMRIEAAYNEGWAAANWEVIEKCRVER
jgi:hypothetical protein